MLGQNPVGPVVDLLDKILNLLVHKLGGLLAVRLCEVVAL